MMHNIYLDKTEKGYKNTSKDCFYFETELMRENIKKITALGITVCYVFDAIFVRPEDLEKVKQIMNNQADMFGLLTTV